MNTTTKDLNPGKVWWFYCLHECTAEHENPAKKGETEVKFVVKGKKRPCLIFGQKNSYCIVWKMTDSVTKHPVEMRTHKGRQMGYLRELTFRTSTFQYMKSWSIAILDMLRRQN